MPIYRDDTLYFAIIEVRHMKRRFLAIIMAVLMVGTNSVPVLGAEAEAGLNAEEYDSEVLLEESLFIDDEAKNFYQEQDEDECLDIDKNDEYALDNEAELENLTELSIYVVDRWGHRPQNTLYLSHDYTFCVEQLPEGYEKKDITWESSNTYVLAFYDNGRILSMRKGEVTITAECGVLRSNLATMASSRSPVQLPLAADMEMGSPRPRR